MKLNIQKLIKNVRTILRLYKQIQRFRPNHRPKPNQPPRNNNKTKFHINPFKYNHLGAIILYKRSPLFYSINYNQKNYFSSKSNNNKFSKVKIHEIDDIPESIFGINYNLFKTSRTISTLNKTLTKNLTDKTEIFRINETAKKLRIKSLENHSKKLVLTNIIPPLSTEQKKKLWKTERFIIDLDKELSLHCDDDFPKRLLLNLLSFFWKRIEKLNKNIKIKEEIKIKPKTKSKNDEEKSTEKREISEEIKMEDFLKKLGKMNIFNKRSNDFLRSFMEPNEKEKTSKDKNKENDKKPKRKEIDFDLKILKYILGIPLAIIFVLYFVLKGYQSNEQFKIDIISLKSERISFNKFVGKYLTEKIVEEISFNENNALIKIKNSDKLLSIDISNIENFAKIVENEQRQNNVDIIDYVPLHRAKKLKLNAQKRSEILRSIVFMTLIVILIRTALKSTSSPSNLMFGTFNKKSIQRQSVKTRLSDVAGMKNAKMEVKELSTFLTDSSRFVKLGARIPKGALLIGPPGTGKTLLAKAIAGESNCAFFATSGSEFLEMFVGMGASRVRKLFKAARSAAPAIVFIDEIDALGGKRRKEFSDDERERTLNQLLVEMDGFNLTENVIVLAGTNRVDMLDKALLRPGRFDRKIAIDLPDIAERKEIFEVHLRPIKLASSVTETAERLSALTPGFSGADIANICNEGAIIAVRLKKERVEIKDFQKAFDRVIAGLEKSSAILTLHERNLIAHHEAGHAIAGWYLPHADPLLKVTIQPHVGGALGYAQLLPKETAIHTLNQIDDKMCVALGGRIAEKMFFSKYSTGAANDLEQVTQLAYNAVKVLGMSDKVGHLSFPERGYNPRLYGEDLAKTIDNEAQRLIKKAYRKTELLLASKYDKIALLAKVLLEKETITHDEMVKLIGERPFKGFHYKKYLENIEMK